MRNELTNAQIKTVIDAEQLFDAYLDAKAAYKNFNGGMHWKTISGKQYLYKTLDRNGNAKSLGVLSEKTKLIYDTYINDKAKANERVKSLAEKLTIQEKLNKVFRVGHVPNEIADICIQIQNADLFRTNFMVIGTNAIHAYIAMTGVRFNDDIMATTDIDLLWSHKSKLSLLATSKMQCDGLIGLLRKADNSFEVKTNQTFRAISNRGFMVDLIRQMPSPPWKQEPDQLIGGAPKDLVATDIWNMKWLLNAPRLEQTLIALDGRMFKITCPVPQAFVIFKYWLSQSDERDVRKKSRDLEQSKQIYQLTKDKLPQYNLNYQSLQSFPKKVIEQMLNFFEIDFS
jgi:hypothetical protein